jgi:hypothetical protein
MADVADVAKRESRDGARYTGKFIGGRRRLGAAKRYAGLPV